MSSRLWISTLAVIVSMSLLAVAMSSIFSDVQWLPPVLFTVVVVALSGALLRLSARIQASGLTVLLQLVIGIITVLILCVPETLAFGIVPTPDSVLQMFSQLSSGIDDMYKVIPPAESTRGFTTILVVGFGLITMLIDGLVQDLNVPKIAGVLLLLVYCIPVFLAPSELRWWHFAAVGGAFIVLMLTPYFQQAESLGPLPPLLAGGLALLLGVGLPVLLPDVSVRPPRQPQQADITVVNPFLDLRSNLEEQSDDPVFAYSSTDPLQPPIRLTSVSEFDGQTWQPAEFDIDPFAIAVDGLPNPPGVSTDTTTTEQTMSVNVGGFDQAYLPAPYAPSQIDGVSRRWIYDSATLTIVGNGEIAAEQEYTATYTSVEPTAEELSAARPVSAGQFADTLALPEDMPAVVSDTADEVTSGAQNPWEQAVMLQEYFHSDAFEYSLDAPEEASSDAIADFLDEKSGYCVQFSGAMTAMSRSLGIPARIAVGFAPGEETGENAYEVAMSDAHAWPELYFDGVGWVRFEPTPGGPAGAPPPWSQTGGAEPEGEPTEEPTEEASAEPSEEPTGEDAAPEEEEDEDTTAADTEAESAPRWWIPVAVLAVLLLAAAPALVRIVQRRKRMREPIEPEAVWEEIFALGIDYGQAPAASVPARQHLDELRDAITAEVSGTDADYLPGVFDDLGEAIDQARYLDRSRSDLQHAAPLVDKTGVDEAVEALRKHYDGAGSRGASLRARLWPASVFRRR
ncbi:transglutaminaseTgpA domain-containing protein [Brevibacterium otitidis]|uniref:TransglutaminaseTgpA domain-containing protein n=1 Tax=Brevibacterium otitidis TaxID=53364 RepID=A0ABV5X6E0_9MICO|nr:DUF3488 and transglutaminase-like domain-containing protein [Brevibacterium otitidis]